MKILLINPNILDPPIFPVGLEYNAEFLKNYGCDVEILDMNSEVDYRKADDCDLVLIGIRNLDSGAGNIDSEMNKLRQIVGKLRARYSGDIGIAGTAVNILPEKLADFLQVEYALVQKGFGAVRALIDNLRHGRRDKRIYRDYTGSVNGVFRRNFLDKSFYLKNQGRIGVATKFGCPFQCQYCNYPAIDGNAIVLRDPGEVAEEVECIVENGAARIFFCDSNFNIPEVHANRILEKLLEKKLAVDIDGFNNPHPRAFTGEYLDLLSRFGNNHIHFGIDSLSDAVLYAIRKGFTVSDVEKAVHLCRMKGITYSCSLLFGHPSETTESVEESFRNVKRLGFSYVDVSSMVRIYPFTELETIALKEGIINKTDSLMYPFFYPVREEVLQAIEKGRRENPCCHEPGYQQYITL